MLRRAAALILVLVLFLLAPALAARAGGRGAEEPTGGCAKILSLGGAAASSAGGAASSAGFTPFGIPVGAILSGVGFVLSALGRAKGKPRLEGAGYGLLTTGGGDLAAWGLS